MSDQTTYRPIVGKENNFKRVPKSRGTEKKIHALEVRFAGIELQQRRAICQIEKWTPEETIPELNQETRIGVRALKAMLDRTEYDDEQLRSEMEQLVEDYDKEHDPVAFISADEYWMELAGLLLVGFRELAESQDTSPDDLNFEEIRKAYTDFF